MLPPGATTLAQAGTIAESAALGATAIKAEWECEAGVRLYPTLFLQTFRLAKHVTPRRLVFIPFVTGAGPKNRMQFGYRTHSPETDEEERICRCRLLFQWF
jgi:hypothetical protein